jgi:hypothetical protein
MHVIVAEYSMQQNAPFNNSSNPYKTGKFASTPQSLCC